MMSDIGGIVKLSTSLMMPLNQNASSFLTSKQQPDSTIGDQGSEHFYHYMKTHHNNDL